MISKMVDKRDVTKSFPASSILIRFANDDMGIIQLKHTPS